MGWKPAAGVQNRARTEMPSDKDVLQASKDEGKTHCCVWKGLGWVLQEARREINANCLILYVLRVQFQSLGSQSHVNTVTFISLAAN